MRKQILRWLLGACYVVLVTLLLLNQMGVMGETRNSAIGVLGTLFLGIALAVVLVLYIQMSDQIKSQGGAVMSETMAKADSKTERQQVPGAGLQTEKRQIPETADAEEPEQELEIKDTRRECDREPQSYEEVYALFLDVTQEYVLSERELEVAWLLYRGYTNRQIGEELYIAETTVKKHVSHIYQKMEVYSRKDFRTKIQLGR